MATIQTRALALEDTFVKRMTAGLLAATALAGTRTRSPFDSFGVLVAGDVAPRLRSRKESGFTIREARSRIGDFLDGTFKPKSIGELMHYLSGRMLRIELRRTRDGSSANYLVDRGTRQSVLAASVDRRLARPGLARMFGRTIEAEAEAVRRKVETSPEMAAARRLRLRNTSRFLNAHGRRPFADWQDFRFSAPAMFENRELTAQGREIWIGQEVARASASPEENLALMKKAADEGTKLVLPARTRADLEAGRLVPGMPILLRRTAIRTRLIDESLSFKSMSRDFGEDPYSHFETLAARIDALSPLSDRTGKVVSMAEFRKKFVRPAEPVVDTTPPIEEVGTFRSAARYTIRHELDETGRELYFLVDAAGGDSKRVDPRRLPAGRYGKEDAFGLPSGLIVVDAEQGFAHYDESGRFHNPFGPAIVPAADSGEPPRFAIEGRFVSRRDFQNRGAALPMAAQKSPEPQMEETPSLGMRK